MLAWARRRSRPPMRGSGPVSCVGASVFWRAARASVIARILLPDSKRGINVPQDELKFSGLLCTHLAATGRGGSSPPIRRDPPAASPVGRGGSKERQTPPLGRASARYRYGDSNPGFRRER